MAEVDGVGPPEVTSTLAESEEEDLQSPLEVPRPKRAQGQWELGYREPLTPQEQNKRNQDGLDVYDRIIHHYAVNGWDSIDPADLTGRFRWYGLYTQRPEEDKMFMMRVRVPGGQLSAEQLLAVAGIARRLGGGVVDVTAGQNFQFHNRRDRCVRVSRRHSLCPGREPSSDRHQGVLQPAPQIQDLDHRMHPSLWLRRGERHRRRGPPRRGPRRLRRARWWRAVYHAAHGSEPRGLCPPGGAGRGLRGDNPALS